MSIAICPRCGDRFQKDLPWKKVCLPCWQESKRAEQTELQDLREEAAFLRGLLARIAAERKAASIDPDMLARLVRLCHPDKHGNSEASNVATAWLLAQRQART